MLEDRAEEMKVNDEADRERLGDVDPNKPFHLEQNAKEEFGKEDRI